MGPSWEDQYEIKTCASGSILVIRLIFKLLINSISVNLYLILVAPTPRND